MFVESPKANPVRVSKYHEAAEAIRRGCKMAPRKLRNEFISLDGEAACALGAMALGAGAAIDLNWPDQIDDFLRQRFPELYNRSLRCVTLATHIQMLNDVGQYSREEIADWLETL